MDLYSCKVRLAGSLENEVIKKNVTAAEIHLLKLIHTGQHPGVVDIVKTGYVKNRSDLAERTRLASEYTRGELVEDRGNKLITALFGVSGVPLPQTYVAPVDEPTEVVVEDGTSKEEIISLEEIPVVKAKAQVDLIG